jgi:hypothetical protein
MEVISLAPISNCVVRAAMKWLQQTISVALNSIPVIKGCAEIFVPVLEFNFSLRLSQNTFPNFWK